MGSFPGDVQGTLDVFSVSPKSPVDPQIIRLSVQDAYSPKLWVTQTHFWPLNESRSFDQSYEILKEGLSRLVAEFPGLLGTIERRSDDPRDLQIEVKPGGTVEFSSEDVSFHDGVEDYATYRTQGFPMTVLAPVTSPKITLIPVSEGGPMFASKLNKLNGGMALTFGFNHVLTDASAIAELERIWALHTADASAGREQKHRPEIDTDTIYQRLSTPVPDAGEFKEAHWAQFQAEKSQLNLPREKVNVEAAMTMLEATKRAHLASMGGNIQPLKWCIWKFSPESLVQLKKDALDPNATKWISTMDALIGLFWSRIARAKLKSQAGHTRSQVAFPVNIRHRLQPPVDPRYIGNLVDILVAECPLAELEVDSTGIAAAAQGVRKGVESWSQPTWEAWLTKACTLPPDQAICPNPVLMLASQNLAFNDYSKSQSNTLNWGADLGRIDRTRYLRPAASLMGCASGVVVHPRLPDGGLEVAVTCDTKLLEFLEKDSIFRKYNDLVAVYE